MERRIFIQHTGIITGAALIAPSLMSTSATKQKLVILHTNDTHSNIDPFPVDHDHYANTGGLSRRAAVIASIRDQEEQVLLLDSGDIFRGTPYFEEFNGALELKAMSQMGYDAATLGNHEFANGLDGLKAAKTNAAFPFVSANYDFSKTNLINEILPHTIIKKGKRTIGIFGLGIDPRGLIDTEKTGGMTWSDPIASATEQVKQLTEKGCDFIICLSHLGHEYADTKISDKILASQTEGIHVILGGHTHTFLEEPVLVKNKAGNEVIINQAGYGGLVLGRLDIVFSGDDRFTLESTPILLTENGKV